MRFNFMGDPNHPCDPGPNCVAWDPRYLTPEGRAAKAYLLDRGLDSDAMARFGVGFAPSGGEALLRALQQKYPEKVLEGSGLFSRDQNGRLFGCCSGVRCEKNPSC